MANLDDHTHSVFIQSSIVQYSSWGRGSQGEPNRRAVCSATASFSVEMTINTDTRRFLIVATVTLEINRRRGGEPEEGLHFRHNGQRRPLLRGRGRRDGRLSSERRSSPQQQRRGKSRRVEQQVQTSLHGQGEGCLRKDTIRKGQRRNGKVLLAKDEA